MKMPCHLLLGKLAESFPSHVLAALDSLVPALHATLTARVKQEAVKQEVCCCLVPDLLGCGTMCGCSKRSAQSMACMHEAAIARVRCGHTLSGAEVPG